MSSANRLYLPTQGNASAVKALILAQLSSSIKRWMDGEVADVACDIISTFRVGPGKFSASSGTLVESGRNWLFFSQVDFDASTIDGLWFAPFLTSGPSKIAGSLRESFYTELFSALFNRGASDISCMDLNCESLVPINTGDALIKLECAVNGVKFRLSTSYSQFHPHVGKSWPLEPEPFSGFESAVGDHPLSLDVAFPGRYKRLDTLTNIREGDFIELSDDLSGSVVIKVQICDLSLKGKLCRHGSSRAVKFD